MIEPATMDESEDEVVATKPAPSPQPEPRSVAIRIEGIWKTYYKAPQPAVRNLSLEVHDGEVVTLLGPSGCGKTTTLRMVAGLEQADAGTIHFGDRTIVDTAKHISLAPDKRKLG